MRSLFNHQPIKKFTPTFPIGFSFVCITNVNLHSSQCWVLELLIHCCIHVWCTYCKLPKHKQGVMRGKSSSPSQWQIRQISPWWDMRDEAEWDDDDGRFVIAWGRFSACCRSFKVTTSLQFGSRLWLLSVGDLLESFEALELLLALRGYKKGIKSCHNIIFF